MKVSWKHALYVGGFLGILCGVLGLAIAGGDLLTRDVIAKNKAAKEASGLKKAFVIEGASYGNPIEIKGSDHLIKYWTVSVEEEEVGRVYSASGKNAYGDIALLVGLYADTSLASVIVLENTQSYGQTLQDNYLDPLSQAEDKDAIVDNVKCGATYGAKLCRELINDAKNHYGEDIHG